ncbi:MAG: hypothetical protein ACRD12_10125 [Acidimicrobiales bacterium]
MRRMLRSTGGILLVTLAALAMVSCSTSDVSGGQQAAIDQADPICLEAQQKIGLKLGDEPTVEAAALKQATDGLMAIAAPSENLTTWKLFTQNVNNLWLNMFDVAESLAPIVNDRPRAQRALEQAATANENVVTYATDYKTEVCKNGFAPQGTQLKA